MILSSSYSWGQLHTLSPYSTPGFVMDAGEEKRWDGGGGCSRAPLYETSAYWLLTRHTELIGPPPHLGPSPGAEQPSALVTFVRPALRTVRTDIDPLHMVHRGAAWG